MGEGRAVSFCQACRPVTHNRQYNLTAGKAVRFTLNLVARWMEIIGRDDGPTFNGPIRKTVLTGFLLEGRTVSPVMGHGTGMARGMKRVEEPFLGVKNGPYSEVA